MFFNIFSIVDSWTTANTAALKNLLNKMRTILYRKTRKRTIERDVLDSERSE